MIEIIPAIIPKNFSELTEKMSLVEGNVELVQIDISDGKFTENKTWPSETDNDFLKIIKEEVGFPFWETLDFEVHLMVEDPVERIQEWVSAGAKRILIHYESFVDSEKILQFCKNFKEKYSATLGPELGVALKLETPITSLKPLIPHISFVQLMSIGKLGFQGVGIPFEPSVLEKIHALRSIFNDFSISVDGAITLDNAKEIVSAGANRLVIGGAIFQSDDIPDTINKLKLIAES